MIYYTHQIKKGCAAMFRVIAYREGEENPFVNDPYSSATIACSVLYDRNRAHTIEYGYVWDEEQKKKIMQVGEIFVH